MSRLDALIDTPRPAGFRVPALAVCTLIATLVAWSAFAQLDEVSVAVGEVVPKSQLKVIQHFEGGIIQNLDVVEGAHVKAGEVLLRLDLAGGGVNREELQVQLDGLLLRRARLTAQARRAPLELPEDVAARRKVLESSERNSFAAWQRELQSKLDVASEQITQREREIRQLAAQRHAAAADLRLARERLGMSASLLQEGLTPRMEHLQIEAQVEKLAGEIEILKEAIPRAESALAESRAHYREAVERATSEATEALGGVELQIARTQELMSRASDQVLRAEIRSPIDGVVKNMRYHTIGGVVRPGEPIMEIVPTSANLVIQARLNPVDRGYVREGQRAVVKISTYDFVRYGSLEGVVERIGADTNSDQSGQPWYEVVVRTEKTYLGEEAGMLPISPGMQATVDIHTGTRSVLNYLVKPVLKLRHEAFRER